MSLSKAIVTLSLKKMNEFISAFNGKVLFGVVNDGLKYVKNQHFVIPCFQLHFWYQSIVQIASAFSEKKPTDESLIAEFEQSTYFWNISQNLNLCFGIKLNDETVFKTLFVIEEFNNFILVLKNIIFHCLCLKSYQFCLFETASHLKLSEILELKKSENCKRFVETTFSKSPYKIPNNQILVSQTVLQYYLEFIVLHHKLESFYNTEENFTNKIISLMIS